MSGTEDIVNKILSANPGLTREAVQKLIEEERMKAAGLLTEEAGKGCKTKIVEFIRENFSDVLGEDAKLLDTPEGLEKLSTMLRSRKLFSSKS